MVNEIDQAISIIDDSLDQCSHLFVIGSQFCDSVEYLFQIALFFLSLLLVCYFL